MVWSRGDQKQIDFNGGYGLLMLVNDADLQKLFSQFILSHLETELLIYFPLNNFYYTMNLSSAWVCLEGKVKL